MFGLKKKKKAKIEQPDEGSAEFFKSQEKFPGQPLINDLYALGLRSEDFYKNLEDKLKTEGPGRNYKVFTAKNFEDFTNEPASVENEELIAGDLDLVPPEVAEQIGGAFKSLYKMKGASLYKLENVFNADAKIKALKSGLKLHPELAGICHDSLYDSVKFALGNQAKELRNLYKNLTKDIKPEFVFLTFDEQPYTVKGLVKAPNPLALVLQGTDAEKYDKKVNKIYNYRLCRQFRLYALGKNKYSGGEVCESADIRNPQLLNLLLPFDVDFDEKKAETEHDVCKLFTGFYEIPMKPDMEKEMQNIIDNLEFADHIYEYDGVKLPNGMMVLPKAVKYGPGTYVKENGHSKKVILEDIAKDHQTVYKIPTNAGNIYVDWHAGADKLVKAIAKLYLKNKGQFYEISAKDEGKMLISEYFVPN